MKKFWIYLGSAVGITLLSAYLAFLFYLPRAIDLNEFKPMIQEIAKEQGKVDLDFQNPRIVTTPHLQAGIKLDDITIKLPDGSTLFDAENLQVRISLPNLFLLTVKVPCAEINSPKINLDIANNEQFKLVKVIEDILNEKLNEPQKVVVQTDKKGFQFNPKWIKIKIPKATVNNYQIKINDLLTGHYLELKGDKLVAGYNNGKFAKARTSASIFSDEKENITLNIALNTFIPPSKPSDPDDDPVEKIVFPFSNPILKYREYDLQSDVDMKIKARQTKDGKVLLKGFLNIENTTLNLAGYQLPKWSSKTKFHGTKIDTDTNIFVAENQNLNIKGKLNYGKKPFADLDLISNTIYFNDLLTLSKAILNSLHINNNLAQINANGYFLSNAHFKTNFKKVKSKGAIVVRNGKLENPVTGLAFDKINANLIFLKDTMKIVDTHAYINNNLAKIEGSIDTDTYTDLSFEAEKLPIPELFKAFAPADLKKSILINSGNLNLVANIKGELKKPISRIRMALENFSMSDKKSTYTISNDKLAINGISDIETLNASVNNNNLNVKLHGTNSTISVPQIKVHLDENKIEITPLSIDINKATKIQTVGNIQNYFKNPLIDIITYGRLGAEDLRQFLGESAVPFISATGFMPMKADVKGSLKKLQIITQIESDSQNYLTPVDIEVMQGKKSILQAKMDYKGDRIHIRDTGFYTGVNSFTDNLESNLEGTHEVVSINGTIVNLNSNPFINQVRIKLPLEIKGKLTAFKNSIFTAGGKLLVFGKADSPLMNGNFYLNNLSIPELLTTLDNLNIDLSNKNINLNVNNLLLNGSDINVALKTDINPHPVFTISGLDVTSKNFNLDNTLKILDKLNPYLVQPTNPAPKSTEPMNIPVELSQGTIKFNKISTGNINIYDTTGRIALKNNNFYLNNLQTTAFKGLVTGNIGVNIPTTGLDIKLKGTAVDVEDALLSAVNMKDTISGTAEFTTDIQLAGTTLEEQMKSLTGNIHFEMFDGQLGPFGKLENMILAENIRESKFFQTALGGVINSIATIDTSRFDVMKGDIAFSDGIVHINPITSAGNVLCLYIAGDFNLLENTVDMKVRTKLASMVSSMLGPIAQLNPINLVKVTPGLNVVMAQAFSLFTAEASQEELDAIPNLQGDSAENLATKFQIVLEGDVAKPFSLVKSFKWLALDSELQAAEAFVKTLPDPSIVGDVENATIEQILAAQEAKAKEDAKLINRVKRFFTKDE